MWRTYIRFCEVSENISKSTKHFLQMSSLFPIQRSGWRQSVHWVQKVEERSLIDNLNFPSCSGWQRLVIVEWSAMWQMCNLCLNVLSLCCLLDLCDTGTLHKFVYLFICFCFSSFRRELLFLWSTILLFSFLIEKSTFSKMRCVVVLTFCVHFYFLSQTWHVFRNARRGFNNERLL